MSENGKSGSASPATHGDESNNGGFLEALDVDERVQGKTVDEIANLIDTMAQDITDEDIVQQNEILDRDVADMKQFMDKAVRDGVLVDDTDETADDGTILLKNKAGDFNPLLDAVEKKRADLDSKYGSAGGVGTPKTTESSSSLSSAVRPAVIVHIPLSGARKPEETMRYAAAAVQDAVRRGEAPFCPLLQSITVVGMGQLTKDVDVVTAQTLMAFRGAIPQLRVYTDLDHEQKFGGQFGPTTVLRSLDPARQKELDATQRSTRQALESARSNSAVKASADSDDDVDDKVVEMAEAEDDQIALIDEMPDKTRINRYTKDENGKPVQSFPDGVAGYAADGRVIPIVNDGPDFDPKIPNVLGDMQYRNDLLSTKIYDPKDWFYKRFDKFRYMVVAYMGPENCNVKYKDYFMVVFGVAKTKSDCKKIVEHVRRKKNCYHGRMFNLGVVELGEWFATAPPRFAKEATASYSNPLHREYMQSYIENQKRTTVELEQRVLDDEVRARQKTNTLQQQLQEKQMNPDLAPSAQQVEIDIAAQRKADAEAANEARRIAALSKEKADAAAQRAAAAKKRLEAPLGEQPREPRPAALTAAQRAATIAGGARRAIAPRGRGGAVRGRGRGRGGSVPTHS